jgi:hypothetical protein
MTFAMNLVADYHYFLLGFSAGYAGIKLRGSNKIEE